MASILYDEDGNVTSVALGGPEEPEAEYAITIRDKHVNSVNLAQWILKTGFQCTHEESIYLAERIILGETWRPLVSQLNVDPNPHCNITVI